MPRIPSIVIAVVIALAAIAWIGSGFLDGTSDLAGAPEAVAEAKPVAPPAKQKAPTRVRVETLTAENHVGSVDASGQTEALRKVEIRAETDGRIVEVLAKEGRMVEAGTAIVRLDQADREARLSRAEARVEQRRIQYNAANKLADKGFQSQTRKAEALADLREARAALEEIRIDLARTEIVAPFSGVLDRRPVEIGDYVQPGEHVATVVQIDPIVVTAMVPEQDAPKIEIGMLANTRLASGAVSHGAVTYVAAVADEQTRTFKVEVEIPNRNHKIGEGMTAELSVPLPAKAAHLVSPSIFRLNRDGRIGVMIVEADGRAAFTPVQVVGTDEKGAWVTGLPQTATVIVVGQELVEPGELVEAVSVDEVSS